MGGALWCAEEGGSLSCNHAIRAKGWQGRSLWDRGCALCAVPWAPGVVCSSGGQGWRRLSHWTAEVAVSVRLVGRDGRWSGKVSGVVCVTLVGRDGSWSRAAEVACRPSAAAWASP